MSITTIRYKDFLDPKQTERRLILRQANNLGPSESATSDSIYKFVDKPFKLLSPTKSDELVRHKFNCHWVDGKIQEFSSGSTLRNIIYNANLRFHKVPYFNSYHFVYKSPTKETKKGGNETFHFQLATPQYVYDYEHLRDYERYDAKMFFGADYLKNEQIDINNSVIDIKGRWAELKISTDYFNTEFLDKDTILDDLQGVYSNPMFINLFHELTDALFGDFDGTEINNGGWWWHQSHERLEFPNLPEEHYEGNVFASNIYYHNLSETEFYRNLETRMHIASKAIYDVFNTDRYTYKNKDGDVDEYYTGLEHSFGSGLYDKTYSTEWWMGAKGIELETENLVDRNERIVSVFKKLVPYIYCEVPEKDSEPVPLFMVFNQVPIRMKCNKVGDRTYIYSWPEYMMKNAELLNGCDYISYCDEAQEVDFNKCVFYEGKIDAFYREYFATYEQNRSPVHAINYADSVVKYEHLQEQEISLTPSDDVPPLQ